MTAPGCPTSINHRYRVIRELGRGGMGRVLLVEDLHLEDRLMALKTILPERASEEFLERFRVEFSGLAKLSHPHIAAAHDFGRILGTNEHFFTTEFIDGVDLLQATAEASADQLTSIIQQTLRGLDFIHSHGLLHNDLKPSNLLLEPLSARTEGGDHGHLTRLEEVVLGAAGNVKILDFGLLSAEDTAWKKILGTPQYLSPERIRCAKADRRSDLYSIGIVFYLLCVRAHPFTAPSTAALLHKHLDEPAPSLAKHRPDLPAPLIQLVDRLVQKRPEERFESAGAALRFLGEAQQRGKAAAVPEVRSKAPEVVPGSLVERHEELRFLERCYEEASTLAPSAPCVAVVGPQGSGKTRLVEEMRGPVQVSGGAFISVGGTAVEGHLLPVAAAVLRGLETSGAVGLGELRRRLSARPDDALSEFLEECVLEQAAQRPLVLHFDDFQRASETVRRFALELVHSTCERRRGGAPRPRLLVIISRRAEGVRGDLRVSGLSTLKLEPLSAGASRCYLKTLFAQDDAPEEVVDSIAATAGGNPGLILELARELIAKGIVVHNGSRWVFPPSLGQIPLPGSMQGLLERRIAALDKRSKALLEWLSCDSIPLSSRVLARCAGIEAASLEPLLDGLVEKGIAAVVEREGAQAPLYALAHEGVRGAAEVKLEPGRKRFLHQRIAQAIEEDEDEKADGSGGGEAAGGAAGWVCEALAHHWLEARNDAAFLRYAPAAAASLRRGGDLELAADYHRRIVEGMPLETTVRRIQSLARLSEMHELLWDLDASLRDLDAILSLGRDVLKPAERAALLRRAACLEIALHQNEKALEALDRGRQCLEAKGAPGAASLVSFDAPEAWAAWFAGLPGRAEAALARAEEALERAPATPRERSLAAAAANQVASLHHQLGRLSRAAQVHERQLELLEGLDSVQAEAATRCSYGSLLLDAGNPSRALDELVRAVGLAKKAGDRRTLSKARERLAECHLRHGDPKIALQMAQVGLQDAEAIRNPSATASMLRTLGRIYLRAGEEEDAALVCARALETHLSAGDPIGAPLSRLELARILLDEERLPEARRHAEEAAAEGGRRGLALVVGLSSLLRAELELRETGRLGSGHLESAERVFRASGYASELCDASLLAVRADLETGYPERAAEILARASGPLEAAGSHEQRARARLLALIIELARGRTEAAARGLSELEAFARNSLLPRIARQCKEALRQIALPVDG